MPSILGGPEVVPQGGDSGVGARGQGKGPRVCRPRRREPSILPPPRLGKGLEVTLRGRVARLSPGLLRPRLKPLPKLLLWSHPDTLAVTASEPTLILSSVSEMLFLWEPQPRKRWSGSGIRTRVQTVLFLPTSPSTVGLFPWQCPFVTVALVWP